MPYRKPKYYSTKKVVVKPKVHWALCRMNKTLNLGMPANDKVNWESSPDSYCYATQSLCEASSDSTYQPGLTKKIKHLKVDITKIKHLNSEIDKHMAKLKAYIVYLPQGVNFTPKASNGHYSDLAETLTSHPEWIMAEKNINPNGTDSSTGNLTHSINCKLTRNLKSGDKVLLVLVGYFHTLSGFECATYHATQLHFNLEWSFASCL